MSTYPGSPDKSADFSGLLKSFPPVSIEEMDSVRLMNRIDTKYLTDTETLPDILSDALACGYRIFEKSGVRLHGYDSVYFDTDDLKMFTEHRRGKAVRQKIRTRMYEDSGECFLEVKRKNNHARTRKKRVSIPETDFCDFRTDAAACKWLEGHSPFDGQTVSPALETRFRRITLVSPGMNERLTIDSGVTFRNLRLGTDAGLGKAVVIELKQDGRTRSPMRDILLRHRIKPYRISKYCIGTVSTDARVLPGRFKEKLRAIRKLNNNNLYTRCYKAITQPMSSTTATSSAYRLLRSL